MKRMKTHMPAKATMKRKMNWISCRKFELEREEAQEFSSGAHQTIKEESQDFLFAATRSKMTMNEEFPDSSLTFPSNFLLYRSFQ